MYHGRNFCSSDLPLFYLADTIWRRFRGDADGFVEGSEEMAAGGSRSVHNIAPALVRINGDKALSESVCSILARFEYQGVQYDLISYARLLSRLERVDSEWKLLTMEALYDKDTIVPVVPNSPTTNLTIPEGSRESYKGLGWLLAQRGFTINPELPGVDRPGSSEAVIEEGVEWLNE